MTHLDANQFWRDLRSQCRQIFYTSRMGYDVCMNIPNDHSYPRAYSGYTLLESIGQGGMSAIDLAQTTVTDAQYVRFVVIKRMHAHLGETDDSYIRMFQDEGPDFCGTPACKHCSSL